MEYINATPHRIKLIRDDGSELVLERSHRPVRVSTTIGSQVDTVDGVAIHAAANFNGVTDLPPRRDGSLLIVSLLSALAVAALHPDRDDVVYPATAYRDGAIRDSQTRVVSVARLIRAA